MIMHQKSNQIQFCYSDEDDHNEDQDEGFHQAKITVKEQKKVFVDQLPQIKHKNLLPEALPLIEQNRPTDFQPRLLLKNIQMKQRYFINILRKIPEIIQNNYSCLILSSDEIPEIEDNINSSKLSQNKEIKKKKNYKSLYSKYQNNFNKIYCKYQQNRTNMEISQNFAGYYLNLSHLVDFGNSMFQILQDVVDFVDQPIQNFNQELIFDSKFECGNLFQVYRQKQNEYDLIMQNDINTKGYAQWFFFSVRNMKKDQKYMFNIINFAKKDNPFKVGMKPAIFSVLKNKEDGTGWIRGGNSIKYKKNKIIKVSLYISINQESQNGSEYFYYSLTFFLSFAYDDDLVYIAANIPYSYSQMIKHIDQINQKMENHYQIKYQTEPTNKQQNHSYHEEKDLKDKKVAIIIARQHPGETVSSYVMHGVIDFLVSGKKEAIILRDKYIFKIIPMVNPDGVIYGNFRCNLSGGDLNRQWSFPNREGYMVDFFADLHGHSKKYFLITYINRENSFMYSCYDQFQPSSYKLFPLIFSKLCNYFSLKHCTFAYEHYKQTSARIVIWDMLQCPNVFALETSLYGYTKSQNKIEHYTPQQLFEIGKDLIRSLYIYNVEQDDQYQFTIQQLKEEMINNANFFNYVSNDNDQDDASDSDPLADEMNIKDKLKSFIPVIVAKTVGYFQNIKDDSKNLEITSKQDSQQQIQIRNTQNIQKTQKNNAENYKLFSIPQVDNFKILPIPQSICNDIIKKKQETNNKQQNISDYNQTTDINTRIHQDVFQQLEQQDNRITSETHDNYKKKIKIRKKSINSNMNNQIKLKQKQIEKIQTYHRIRKTEERYYSEIKQSNSPNNDFSQYVSSQQKKINKGLFKDGKDNFYLEKSFIFDYNPSKPPKKDQKNIFESCYYPSVNDQKSNKDTILSTLAVNSTSIFNNPIFSCNQATNQLIQQKKITINQFINKGGINGKSPCNQNNNDFQSKIIDNNIKQAFKDIKKQFKQVQIQQPSVKIEQNKVMQNNSQNKINRDTKLQQQLERQAKISDIDY